MKIGIVQMELTDILEDNFQKIECLSEEAKIRKIELLCFPECALTGYNANFKKLQKDELHNYIMKLSRVAASMNLALLVGTPFYQEDDLYNSALLFLPNSEVQAYHKQMLTEYDSRFFKPGNYMSVFDYKGFKIGVVVCRDQNDAALFAEYKRLGAKAVIILSAHYYSKSTALKKKDKNKAIPIVRAIDNQIMVCKSNAVGTVNEVISLGGSIIVSESGYVICEADESNEVILEVLCG